MVIIVFDDLVETSLLLLLPLIIMAPMTMQTDTDAKYKNAHLCAHHALMIMLISTPLTVEK